MGEKNEIVLNGEIYVKKGEESEISWVDPYSLIEETKIHNTLKSMLDHAYDYLSEKEALSGRIISVMDRGNVLLITAKTQRAKLILRRYISIEKPIVKDPNLSYIGKKGEKNESCSKYSLEYLSWVISFFNIFNQSESVTLCVKNDYPLFMKLEDWEIIVAPRIED